jgi:hypothetical protein
VRRRVLEEVIPERTRMKERTTVAGWGRDVTAVVVIAVVRRRRRRWRTLVVQHFNGTDFLHPLRVMPTSCAHHHRT